MITSIKDCPLSIFLAISFIVAAEFTFPVTKASKKNSKSEETKVEIKEEDIVAVEETNDIPADAEVVDTVEVVTKEDDGWKEPETTETTGE